MKMDENALEEWFIGHFIQNGYEYVNGNEIARDERAVILADDLKKYLTSRYRDENLTSAELDSIVSVLACCDKSDFVNNRETFNRIRNGFSFRRRDPKMPDVWISFLDFESPENNDFKIVNQYPIRGIKESRRPDALVFVNGIPLVVIEFKSAVREDATIYDAYKQINRRYLRDIPDLF